MPEYTIGGVEIEPAEVTDTTEGTWVEVEPQQGVDSNLDQPQDPVPGGNFTYSPGMVSPEDMMGGFGSGTIGGGLLYTADPPREMVVTTMRGRIEEMHLRVYRMLREARVYLAPQQGRPGNYPSSNVRQATLDQMRGYKDQVREIVEMMEEFLDMHSEE